MIEIVYEKEKQKPEGNEGIFRIPNNIRQIGEVKGTQKIYIEDYAYTYLCRISSENSNRGTAAILLGQVNWKNGVSYLFVKSAVVLSDMEISEDHIAFSQGIWNHVYEKNKEYFAEQEVVGWFLSIPGCSMELHEIICRTHLDHFGGNDKALFVMEPLEKEEAFYRYEEGQMARQPGFYVYYEKNEPMRNYLISRNEKMEKKSEEVDDSAVCTFRKKVEDKTEQGMRTQQNSIIRMAGICAAAVILAVGVMYTNNYKRMKSGTPVMPINKIQAETAQNQQEEAPEGLKEPVQEDQTQEEAGAEEAEAEKAEAEETETEETAAGTHTAYIIKPGDTLTRISVLNYGSAGKIKEICELNSIAENDLIYPGQKILLP